MRLSVIGAARAIEEVAGSVSATAPEKRSPSLTTETHDGLRERCVQEKRLTKRRRRRGKRAFGKMRRLTKRLPGQRLTALSGPLCATEHVIHGRERVLYSRKAKRETCRRDNSVKDGSRCADVDPG